MWVVIPGLLLALACWGVVRAGSRPYPQIVVAVVDVATVTESSGMLAGGHTTVWEGP